MSSLDPLLPATVDAGLLVLRLALGLYMAAHGAQKLLGWFGGFGLEATGAFMAQLGYRPGRAFAAVAAGTELLSGLLVAIGVLGPVGPALMIPVMIVAVVTVHWSGGLFATSNGIELPLLFAAGAAALALTGPGAYSLDALLGLEHLTTPSHAWMAIGAGVLGGLANLAIRRPAQAAPAHAAR
jgi:putative oxidoreductase